MGRGERKAESDRLEHEWREIKATHETEDARYGVSVTDTGGNLEEELAQPKRSDESPQVQTMSKHLTSKGIKNLILLLALGAMIDDLFLAAVMRGIFIHCLIDKKSCRTKR